MGSELAVEAVGVAASRMYEDAVVEVEGFACRVGVTYLTASCREMFNATPLEQINRIRLAHASRLLRERPAMTVTEVAFSVGYNSSQYFATAFRKQFRVNPTQYRGSEGGSPIFHISK